MSRELTELNNEDQFTDTLRHEIAHAIVGPGHHHNTTWKVAAIQVGARPERCYGLDVIEGKAPWVGTCKDCGQTVNRYRATTKVTRGSYHTKCKRAFKANKGEMVWTNTALKGAMYKVLEHPQMDL
jgi:predicted SprT family Zn-dependent metalloprotease